MRDSTLSAQAPELPVAALFDEVIGQPRCVEVLRSAALNPVHAYLFLGSPGSGPKAASLAFAAALLCPRGGCGTCRSCMRALSGTHPDLVNVERVGAALGVDEARRLVGVAQRRPYESKRQVIVVSDVHLAIRSAPALLKTIEEPPASTVFVLLAEDVPAELVTIASRCFEVVFAPIPAKVTEDWLMARGVDGPRARAVAFGCGGDLERARLLAEDDSYAARVELWRSVPSVLDGTGATAGQLARQLLAATETALDPLRNMHASALEEMEEESKSLGERTIPGRREVMDRHHREERRWRTDELRAGLGILAATYRDQLVAVATKQKGANHTVPDDLELSGCGEAVSLVTAASASLERNPNETLLLESLLARLGQATR